MAVKIRLKRIGKVHAPYYRVVVMDSRKKRDGKAIEEIGKYHPLEQPSLIEIDSERAQYWLSVGAQPSEQVNALLRVTGDWQKFKGLEGSEGTLRTKASVSEEERAAVIKATDDEAEKRKATAAEAASAKAASAKDSESAEGTEAEAGEQDS